MYHYVRDLKNSQYPDLRALDINLFIEQIHYLKKYYQFISMEELIDCIENNSNVPKKSILLTFDDAYSDHYKNVFPILDQLNIQGSFYAPSKAISENLVLDVNKIHFVLASVDDKSILVNDLKILIQDYKEEYELDDFDSYYRKLAQYDRMDSKEVIFIKRLLQVELDEIVRNKIVDKLFKKYIGMSETAFSRDLYMNEAQLSHMQRNGHHIGSHGHDHYWWNSLSEEELSLELDLSLKFLKRIGVDIDNWTACYPYGSFDDQAINMLEKKGCKLALTTEVNIASINKNNRFVMPRLDTNDIPKDRNAEPNQWYERA
jgi:peptidoglycan/xylan/chitin deacetylase (PgdA/CDA1 family)